MIISKNEMIGEGQKEKINHFSTCSFCSKYVLKTRGLYAWHKNARYTKISSKLVREREIL
jgi:hypothetical protein